MRQQPGFAGNDTVVNSPSSGLVVASMAGTEGRAGGPRMAFPPLMFERQRLPDAHWISRGSQREMTEAMCALMGAPLIEAALPWTLHAYTPDPQAGGALSSRASRLGDSLREQLERSEGKLKGWFQSDLREARKDQARVVQLCLLEGGAWVSLAPVSQLSHFAPGGVHRMTRDPQAPSRSYLKIEEALERAGFHPGLRERVVDLGAAPGGWSYAFLRRGCRVVAVDNGPMKIPGLDQLPGELEHVRGDGLNWRPRREWTPVDWLVADMLISPGQCLGLLRQWLGQGWASRFVVNIKLPQKQPLSALHPLKKFLADAPLNWYQLRQLYHDRREITLMGEGMNLSSKGKKRRG